MSWIDRLRGRRARDADLSAEIREHLEEKVEELVGAGVPRGEAEQRARRAFGNVTLIEERSREFWTWVWLEGVLADARYGLRMLRKTPGVTTIALLSLALGIGANTAVFSLLDTVMLRMLPVQHPEELVQLATNRPEDRNRPGTVFTNPLWEQVRDHQNVFAAIFASYPRRFDLAEGGEAHFIRGVVASGDYFTALGVRPAAGRLLTSADDRRGCAGTAVLGYGFWQQQYGGAESAIGADLRLNGHQFRVVGVAAPHFFGTDVGEGLDVVLPVCAEAILDGQKNGLDNRTSWSLRVMARLKPGVTAAQAAARLNVLAPQVFAAAAPPQWPPDELKSFVDSHFLAIPAGTGLSGLRRQYDQPLEVLMSSSHWCC